MATKTTPESILEDLAQIQRMDRGTVSVLRQGPTGPYYNHQCYEQGRNTSRYVPREQVPALKEDIASYHRFTHLVNQYVDLVVQRTRVERQTEVKKKLPSRGSSWPSRRKSSS